MAEETQYGNWLSSRLEPHSRTALQQAGIYVLASAPPPPSKDSLNHLDDGDDYDDCGIVTPMVQKTQMTPFTVEEKRNMENQKAPSISEPVQQKDHRRLYILILFFLVAISFLMCTGVLSLVLIKYSALSEELQALNLNFSEMLKRDSALSEELQALNLNFSEMLKRDSALSEELQALNLNFSEMLKRVKKDLNHVKETQKISERTVSNTFSQFEDITASICRSSSINNSCPTKWKMWGGNCYYFSMAKKSWTEALWYCINNRAHLLSIWSDAEEDFLINNLDNSSIYWLGVTDLEMEGKWRWREGGQTASTSFWDIGQPQRSEDKNCGVIHPNGTWASAMCSLPYHWICKQKLIC
ncbi:low affinity immunoglobulin epsilon Fc receptor-like [Elgaria multicarinata webbii]|uniref:low affinity immunoglobulin epsilon Fc receptor-like n=1 Tax=Elgaria multicarinata webbii TaxID=159646 RepID=UPI002FCD2123